MSIPAPVTAALALLLSSMCADYAAASQADRHRNTTGAAVELSLWHPRYRELCAIGGRGPDKDEHAAALQRILDQFAGEPDLAAYLSRARAMGAALCLDDRAGGTRGYYDYHFNVVAVKSSLSPAQQAAIFIHELRHVDHVYRGYQPSLEYAMAEIVRLNYAIEADVQAVAALYAWRIKERGNPDVWQALMSFERYVDIPRAFARVMREANSEALALTEAFRQWYRSDWRTQSYYRGCAMGYLDLLDATKQIPRYGQLPDGFFDELCLLPDGTNYACHQTEEIKRAPRGLSERDGPALHNHVCIKQR